ncbi:hypothetical protein KEM55_005174 [Ascosphaera atra]|nr:hypothetical protein KEM55_005174 [Ascosphaera atra]
MSNKVQVLAHTAGHNAPGWAYVPDTGGAPAAHAPIRGMRKGKRTLRESTGTAGGIGGGAGRGGGRGDLTARQNTAVLRRLAELDRENHKETHIPVVTTKGKELAAKSSRSKTTTNVRKIIASQKTFKNYLDDEEAFLAQQHSQASTSAGGGSRPTNRPSTNNPPPPFTSGVPPAYNPILKEPEKQMLPITPYDDDPLLRSYIPAAPSERIMELLLAEPPLSYNAARATIGEADDRPVRQFCSICGYWGRVRCLRCGARSCGLECYRIHEETRCDRFYA